MDPTRPATHHLLRLILQRHRRPFTQLELAHDAEVSHPWAHRVVQWLVGLGHVRKAGATFQLVNPAGLIGLYPIFRDMRQELVYEADFRIPANARKGLGRLLGPNAIQCLATALGHYSDYSMPGPIQLYARRQAPDVLVRQLLPYAGGGTRVQIYASARMPLLDYEVRDGVTDPIRTTIDLACANQLYLARDLLRQQWGLEIGA